MRPRVLILHTGGTLGMARRRSDQALEPQEFGDSILKDVPELSEIAEVQADVFCNIDSSDVTPERWRALAARIAGAVGSFGGIVVTHGTDSMAYTASALSYCLRNLPLPVILTGAQRPLSDPRSDARANLVGSVDLATRRIPEVGIYFDGALLRGNRTMKRSSFDFAAYRSPHFPPLAEVGAGVRQVAEPLSPAGEFRLEGDFDRRVASLRLLPGQVDAPLRCMARSGLGAVLIEAFGSGNLPVVDRSVADAVAELTGSGVVVAIGSQSRHGRVDLDRYAGGRLAKEVGAVGTADMTTEAAVAKLMYLLATCSGPDEVRARLTVPIAGEVTP
jgi:L-asparaginase